MSFHLVAWVAMQRHVLVLMVGPAEKATGLPLIGSAILKAARLQRRRQPYCRTVDKISRIDDFRHRKQDT
jgi:hypothetical protein